MRVDSFISLFLCYIIVLRSVPRYVGGVVCRLDAYLLHIKNVFAPYFLRVPLYGAGMELVWSRYGLDLIAFQDQFGRRVSATLLHGIYPIFARSTDEPRDVQLVGCKLRVKRYNVSYKL